jgi:hypothetical protein
LAARALSFMALLRTSVCRITLASRYRLKRVGRRKSD